MEISIKSNKDIEELADEIISLNEITTSTSEVKAKIINLINDTLYHKIKNVTLSTIIKDQFEDDEVPSVEEKKEEKPAPTEEPVQETEPASSASSESFTSVTPADVFGAAPKTTEPAVQATEVSQPTETKTQVTETPKPEPVVQTTEVPTPAPQTTQPASQQDISTMEPEAQYEALGEPQTTKITYNGREYELSLKAIKAGALAGKNMLVAIYRVPAEQNAQMMNNPEAYKNFNAQITQMTVKDMGQNTCFYNAQNAMMYTITSKETMNRYINDLDNAVELFNQALQQVPTAPQPVPTPQPQATQPAPVQATQPMPQATQAPKTNDQGINLAKPF